ncbi:MULTISPECIES: hypothetical protein [unclassified Mesorhizobium]|nr:MULTISPECIES: hypothetical protein [unclassified Mesorhizobium]
MQYRQHRNRNQGGNYLKDGVPGHVAEHMRKQPVLKDAGQAADLASG